MGEADFDPIEADLARAALGPAVQDHDGLAAGVGEDLDLAPAHPAHAGAERLHHGFLAREPSCELGGAVATVVKLALGVDALQEALAVPIEHALKALQQQQVDAAGEVGRHCADRITVHSGRSPAATRAAAQSGGRAYARCMAAQLIDGTKIAAGIRASLTTQTQGLRREGLMPQLGVLLVGESPASASYVRGKERAGAETGIGVRVIRIGAEGDASTIESRIGEQIDELNANPDIHGMILQLPLPEGVHADGLLERIDPLKDVDGLHPANQGRILQGRERFLPATPHGVQQLLVRSGNDPGGKHVVIVGRSRLVGMPLVAMLAQKRTGANATVTVCHTNTIDLAEHTRRADILVVASGRPNTVTAEMVRPGAVVIDVGVNRVDDASRKRGYRLVGDVDFEGIREVASFITPVPGGVGPMTVAMLLNNVTRAARMTRIATR